MTAEDDVDKIMKVLDEHTINYGVMASWTHWAYRKGDNNAWFAYCQGDSRDNTRGCGWDSEPIIYPNKDEARAAAQAHLAEKIKEALSESSAQVVRPS